MFKKCFYSCLLGSIAIGLSATSAFADFAFASFLTRLRQITNPTIEASSSHNNTKMFIGEQGFGSRSPEPYILFLSGNAEDLEEAVDRLKNNQSIQNGTTKGITSFSIHQGNLIVSGAGDKLRQVISLFSRGKQSRIKSQDALVLDTSAPYFAANRIYSVIVTARVKVNLSRTDNRTIERPVSRALIMKTAAGEFAHALINISQVTNGEIVEDDCMLYLEGQVGGVFVGEACGSAAASATNQYFPIEAVYDHPNFKLR